MAKCWLMKTEPGCYSIQNLADEPGRTTGWSGVRNYQARNFMRDQMAVGDKVLFYHSVTNPSVVGVAHVSSEALPDPTAFDPQDSHYDPKSTPERPLWFMVNITLERIFSRPVPLAVLRAEPGLTGMELLRRGSRLSVMPVTPDEFAIVLHLAETMED